MLFFTVRTINNQIFECWSVDQVSHGIEFLGSKISSYNVFRDYSHFLSGEDPEAVFMHDCRGSSCSRSFATFCSFVERW